MNKYLNGVNIDKITYFCAEEVDGEESVLVRLEEDVYVVFLVNLDTFKNYLNRLIYNGKPNAHISCKVKYGV